MAIQSIGISRVPLLITDIPEKPRSLRVHEVAIPILKKVLFFLEIVADFSFGIVVEAAFFDSLGIGNISLIIFAVSAAVYWTLKWIEEGMSQRIKQMKDPSWIDYFSAAYRDRPIEELIRDLPNRKVWDKLNWNGLVWKEKILPFAQAHHWDRKKLREEFSSIFNTFNPYLYSYYRSLELPLLQTQGIHAYLAAAGFSAPKTIRDEEMEKQFLKETAGLKAEEIQDQYPIEIIERCQTFKECYKFIS